MPRTVITRALLIAASIAAWAGSAQAQADEAAAGSGLRFNGYGTLGVMHADSTRDVKFLRDVMQPGHSGATSAGVDSRLGLQLNWVVHPDWELVGQAVLRRQDPEAGADGRIDWAFVAWRPDAAWTLRLGRTAPDIFLLADLRSVGYAQTWVRPSVEFYGWLPLQSIDGVDVMRNWRLGDADWRLRLGAGRSSAIIGSSRDPAQPGSTPVARADLRGLQLATLTRESDGLTLKLTAVRSRFSVVNDLITQLQAGLLGLADLGVPGVSPEAATLADDLRLNKVPARYLALGARYDTGPWSLAGETSRVSARTSSVSGRRSYVSVGYHLADVMPFVVWGRSQSDRAAAPPPQTWAATLTPLIGPAAASGAAMLGAAGAATVNGLRNEQNTVALGLRWDFHPQAAFKLQWERVRIAAEGAGAWVLVAPPPFNGTTVRVISATVDFVF